MNTCCFKCNKKSFIINNTHTHNIKASRLISFFLSHKLNTTSLLKLSIISSQFYFSNLAINRLINWLVLIKKKKANQSVSLILSNFGIDLQLLGL